MAADLHALAGHLRSLEDASGAIAREARADVEAAARATAEAGTAPDGAAWKPRKDGGRPLANAAAAITAVVSGTTKAVITLVIKGHYVFHNFGTKREPKRQILPDAKKGLVPAKITEAVRAAARRVVAREVTP